MTQEKLSFEQLPQAISLLTKEVSELKQLLQQSINPQPAPAPQDQLFTIQQAAAFLGLTVATMYTKVSKAELPVMKRGKRLYFSQTELTEYLKTGRKQTYAEVTEQAAAYITNNKKGLHNGI